MANWFHINALDTVFYPTGDITTRDTSRTSTAADSQVKNAAISRIKRLQVGPSMSNAGTLKFVQAGGTTLIREMPAGNVATNVTNNFHSMAEGFDIKGAWGVQITGAAGGVDFYVDYEYEDKWPT